MKCAKETKEWMKENVCVCVCEREIKEQECVHERKEKSENENLIELNEMGVYSLSSTSVNKLKWATKAMAERLVSSMCAFPHTQRSNPSSYTPTHTFT